MKIKIIRNTVVNGVAANEGQVVDAPERDAKFLISIGKAVAFQEPESPTIETADAVHPVVETADVKPPKRKKDSASPSLANPTPARPPRAGDIR